MKKLQSFKILKEYLKNDMGKVTAYIFLKFVLNFCPLFGVMVWTKSYEAVINKQLGSFTQNLILWVIIMIGTWTIIKYITDILYNSLEKKFMENISKDLYTKLGDLPAIAFEEIGTGEFINRIYHDPERILELLARLIRLISEFIVAIIVIILSFQVSIFIGLEFIILSIIMYAFAGIYYPKIKKNQEDVKKRSDEYVKKATQNIAGIREIKGLGIKENVNKEIAKNIDNLFQKEKQIGKIEAVYYGLNNLAYFLLEFIILFTLGYEHIIGIIPLTSFILMEQYIWRIDGIVEALSDFGINFNKVTVSLKRIDEIINNKLYQDEKFGSQILTAKKCTIQLENVFFKYREEEENILNGLSMTLKPNKKIAIVGKSGEGKTTIFNLLLRYFDATTGEITINGINIKDLSEKSLRENVSIIRQSPYIFNDTIFNNFKIVKENVTLKEIREVCKKAYIDDYIMSLPKKYQTIIGEGGINLSGGQKQRLAIARTLLKNTKIILFDEATSALDNSSQEYVKKTIDDLVKTHTIIIVAHRLSTIMDADEIYIIENGKVENVGTHQELLKKSTLYKSLYSPEVLEF